MKNLIKLTIVVFLLLFGTGSFAQNFGLKAGLNLSNLLVKDENDVLSDDFKMNPGIHIGPTVEFPISKIFSFESGLLLSTKGFKVSEKEGYMSEAYEYKLKWNLFYLDIPLTAKATYDFGGVKIYGTFGPYVGMGISGKSKSEQIINGETESNEEDIKFGPDKEEDQLKGYDFGLTMGAGLALKSIQIGFTYGLGLANILVYDGGYSKMNNRVLGISAGYKFGKKLHNQ